MNRDFIWKYCRNCIIGRNRESWKNVPIGPDEVPIGTSLALSIFVFWCVFNLFFFKTYGSIQTENWWWILSRRKIYVHPLQNDSFHELVSNQLLWKYFGPTPFVYTCLHRKLMTCLMQNRCSKPKIHPNNLSLWFLFIFLGWLWKREDP